MAEDGLEDHRLFTFARKELHVAVGLLPVELPDRPEQGLVEVGQGHSDLGSEETSVQFKIRTKLEKEKKAQKFFKVTLSTSFGGRPHCSADDVVESKQKRRIIVDEMTSSAISETVKRPRPDSRRLIFVCIQVYRCLLPPITNLWTG